MKELTSFKRIRLEAGYGSILELAEDSGMDHNSLYRYDQGKATPTLQNAAYLVEFFNKVINRDITVYDVWGDIL